MPKQFFCEGREPNFKFGSAISSLWLRHKLAVEKSAHQCDFSTFLHSEALCSEDTFPSPLHSSSDPVYFSF
jgi:hypothetical protein